MMPSESNSALGMPAREYGSGDVCRISGATPRQLQWWDEHKVVSARRTHRRNFTAADVLEVVVISDLRRKGFSLQKVRRVMRSLRRAMEKPRRDEAWSGISELYLLTDGKSAHLEETPELTVATLAAAKQPMALVNLGEQMRRIVDYRPPRQHAPDQLELF